MPYYGAGPFAIYCEGRTKLTKTSMWLSRNPRIRTVDEPDYRTNSHSRPRCEGWLSDGYGMETARTYKRHLDARQGSWSDEEANRIDALTALIT